MKVKEIQQKNKKLKEKGITLIALVVTIIILLILVGVTISQITGKNGLIRKAKEAVEKYKNSSEEELIQLGKINQYVSDFEIIGGDEGEEKALVSIKENGLEVTGNVEEQKITVKVTVIGESTGVEYKISSEDNWTQKDTDGKVVTEGDQKEIEYTHTFNGLKLGESYYIRVKVYDTNNKYVEALSNVIALNYIMTAEDGDVLGGKTYIGKNGIKSTGTMESRGKVEKALNAEESYTIEPGYYSGGKITAKSLRDQTDGDAVVGDILQGKTAWVDGAQITGTMESRGTVNQTIDSANPYTILPGYYDGGTISATSTNGQINWSGLKSIGNGFVASTDGILLAACAGNDDCGVWGTFTNGTNFGADHSGARIWAYFMSKGLGISSWGGRSGRVLWFLPFK